MAEASFRRNPFAKNSFPIQKNLTAIYAQGMNSTVIFLREINSHKVQFSWRILQMYLQEKMTAKENMMSTIRADKPNFRSYQNSTFSSFSAPMQNLLVTAALIVGVAITLTLLVVRVLFNLMASDVSEYE